MHDWSPPTNLPLDLLTSIPSGKPLTNWQTLKRKREKKKKSKVTETFHFQNNNNDSCSDYISSSNSPPMGKGIVPELSFSASCLSEKLQLAKAGRQ